MSQPPDRVQIWASQLAHNDFPLVCAMTGRPPETWRKFTFPNSLALNESVTGHLPLTRSSSRSIALAVWIPVALLIASPVAFVIAFAFAGLAQFIFPTFFLLGGAALLGGFLGRLVLLRFVSPQGKLLPQQPGQHDRLMELSNVHPAFVAAVRQHQHAR